MRPGNRSLFFQPRTPHGAWVREPTCGTIPKISALGTRPGTTWSDPRKMGQLHENGKYSTSTSQSGASQYDTHLIYIYIYIYIYIFIHHRDGSTVYITKTMDIFYDNPDKPVPECLQCGFCSRYGWWRWW